MLKQKTTISEKIISNKKNYAKQISKQIYTYFPELKRIYTSEQKETSLEDIIYHLEYLSYSIALNKPQVFSAYISWTRNVLESRNIEKKCLNVAIKSIREILSNKFSEKEGELINKYLKKGERKLEQSPPSQESYISEDNPNYDLATSYLDYVLNGKRKNAYDRVLSAVKEGVPIKKIFLNVFQPVQQEIGKLWENNSISVAQEHYATAVTQMIISQLYHYIFREEKDEKEGYILVGACIGGELHELGIRMLTDFFELKGWDTYYLGANTPIQSIIETTNRYNADILAVSATMLKNVLKIRKLVKRIRKNKKTAGLKVIVGGKPFNTFEGLWKSIGADGSAKNAQLAFELATNLIGR